MSAPEPTITLTPEEAKLALAWAEAIDEEWGIDVHELALHNRLIDFVDSGAVE